MIGYEVIRRGSPDELAERVNFALSAGAKLIGGVTVSYDGHQEDSSPGSPYDFWTWAQAVLWPSEEVKP